MTREEIECRIAGLIDDLIPTSSTDEDAAALASILLATLSALRRSTVSSLSSRVWSLLDGGPGAGARAAAIAFQMLEEQEFEDPQ
jgi:hypothetical protein